MDDVYIVLIFVATSVGWGLCIILPRTEIFADSVLNKYRPSDNSILLRLKLFKNNANFNYLLIVPYIISWNIFFLVMIFYILYWTGVPQIKSILESKYAMIGALTYSCIYMLYPVVMQIIINCYNDRAYERRK